MKIAWIITIAATAVYADQTEWVIEGGIDIGPIHYDNTIIAEIKPSSIIELHNPDGLIAILDFSGDTLRVSGDLPLDEAAKEFAVFAHWYITSCYQGALEDALELIGETEADRLKRTMNPLGSLLPLLFPRTKSERLRAEANAIERRDSTIVRLRKILKDGCGPE